MSEEHEFPFVQVSADYNKHVEDDIRRRRGSFVADFLEEQQAKLGTEEFEKQKVKLAEDAGKRFDLAHKAKMKYYTLEEQSVRELMDWADLEKLLRQWLENEGHDTEMVKNAIENEKTDFETRQTQIKQRIAAANYDPDADFRLKVLNPKTREQAFRDFLPDEKHFSIETFKLLFELLDKRR